MLCTCYALVLCSAAMDTLSHVECISGLVLIHALQIAVQSSIRAYDPGSSYPVFYLECISIFDG